jgi:murein DD-endopeptidase MepM/ murein hydrolase activator NlpD
MKPPSSAASVAIFILAATLVASDTSASELLPNGAVDAAPTLRQAILNTAHQDQIPQDAIEQFVRLQALTLDLDQPAGTDGSFKLLYQSGQLLGGVLTFNGETHRFYRFPASGAVLDYYDETGRTLRSWLLRKPIPTAFMQSGFGPKTHPILHVTRMHTGVDWVAPPGTKIIAVGDGIVEQARWQTGYGKQIRIRHADGYETTYSHLSKFAPHLVAGTKVQTGQLIGYVGSTGYSSGPHLHYELIINGLLVDPERTSLPRVGVLDRAALADFQHERERLDAGLEASQAHKLAATQLRDP